MNFFKPNRIQDILQSIEPDYERTRKENELSLNDFLAFVGLVAFIGTLGVFCWVLSLV